MNQKTLMKLNSKRNQLKSFYKPLVLLKLKLYKIYATKIIKVFSVQNIKAKRIFIKNFFVGNFNCKNNYHKEFLLKTKITKSVFEYNDKTH